MNLEQIVTSLELSQRLEELNVKQESLFYWLPIDYGSSKKARISYKGMFDEKYHDDALSAFTASELLEILPSYVGCWLDIIKGRNFGDVKDRYSARYYMSDIVMDLEENICNTLAKMLIHLIENKIIEV